MQIVNKDDVEEAARENDGYFIKSGIVTIIKDAVIPNGTIIWAWLLLEAWESKLAQVIAFFMCGFLGWDYSSIQTPSPSLYHLSWESSVSLASC